MDDPEEFALWAVQSIPLLGTTPATFIEPLARAISRHLDDAGFEHVSRLHAIADENGFIHVSQLKEQRKKWQRPYRGDQHTLNNAAMWVAMDADEPEPVTIQDPALMTRFEREAVAERMRYMGYRVDEPVPEPVKGTVVDTLDDAPRFDPGSHTVTEVNAYLRGLGDGDPIELGRVLFAERNSQARNGILKRWPQ
jgi:hypothetical protein